MKSMKIIFIFAITVLLISAIGPVSAKALDFSSWQNTWHKGSIKWRPVCEVFETQQLVKLRGIKDSYWIYIDTYNETDDNFSAFLFGKDENGAWAGTPFTLHIYQDYLGTPLGTAKDVILESDDITEVDETLGYEIDISFIARLTGKEKLGALNSGKLLSINGTATIILTDLAECVASLTISATFKKAPPVTLTDLVNEGAPGAEPEAEIPPAAELETESPPAAELEIVKSALVKDNIIFHDIYNDCLNLLQK